MYQLTRELKAGFGFQQTKFA